MSAQTLNLTEILYNYYHQVGFREHESLQLLRLETQTLPGARMQISPEQGQFLALLIELMGAKKTLDVGTFTGYSALAVALALPTNGKVIACDISEDSASIAKRYWQMANVSSKIDLHLAPALETLDKLIKQDEVGTFDFVFIDADKNNYAAYYEQALMLLRSGGLIAVDNVLWSGKVADPQQEDKTTKVIRSLNEKIFHDERVTLSMIPIGDGLTLARKR